MITDNVETELNEYIDPTEEDVAKILQYKEKGFFFHGSTNSDIQVLEPRPATDSDPSNTFNNDIAVFASKIPDTCIFGLLDTSQVPKNLLKGSINIGQNLDGHLEAEIPICWKPYMEKNSGTIYILPPDSFLESSPGWQVKSRKSVIPIEKMSVSFNHFEKLGGKVVWKQPQDEISKISQTVQ